MGQPFVEIASDRLRAAINPFGAELSSLRTPDGAELMTDADPAFWAGRAPLLFPIVGRLVDDKYRLDGKEYALPQHGFARRQPFALVEQAADRAVFRLADNVDTRAVYPFAFTLDAAFTLQGATFATDVTVTNIGDAPMPASFGFHPAFAWPLPFGTPRAAHRIVFERDEPAELSAIVNGGWIAPETSPSPLAGRELLLTDELFDRDALVWDSLASTSLRYDGGDGPELDIGFAGMPKLGIWTKPGARFVCIEPWHGIADPVGFAGEIWDKPGILRFEPGESRSFSMQVRLDA
ncbi:aldose 1-epimerase family protein [Sphingomonas psychrotolerans]|uniref:Aldose 1-epimerase family protein n=1 Tax=Sphingomonas psychrotolerans TaxID=1327635 RepID=A0ABU3N4G8_9SPHN|nr:aldose 1-epimerase family protein [Sphingomonas psychrotolerans]MDT8759278.1 aldose 1-epimerase family protein [Sphingomonas psychrotolerans]